MSVYHSFKPVRLFETEIQSDKLYDCKKQKWVSVKPMKYIFWITLESDYPREIFGAPKYYVMYGEWDGDKRSFGSGTRQGLGEAILRFKANECFWNNWGQYAFKAYQEWINKDF